LGADSLAAFTGGFLGLERLVGELKSVLRSLDGVADPAWLGAQIRRWGQLEILYALVLDDGRSELAEDEDADVQEIAENLLREFRYDG
jgi:hypothetical protein